MPTCSFLSVRLTPAVLIKITDKEEQIQKKQICFLGFPWKIVCVFSKWSCKITIRIGNRTLDHFENSIKWKFRWIVSLMKTMLLPESRQPVRGCLLRSLLKIDFIAMVIAKHRLSIRFRMVEFRFFKQSKSRVQLQESNSLL